jgi:hypothetical protein
VVRFLLTWPLKHRASTSSLLAHINNKKHSKPPCFSSIRKDSEAKNPNKSRPPINSYNHAPHVCRNPAGYLLRSIPTTQSYSSSQINNHNNIKATGSRQPKGLWVLHLFAGQGRYSKILKPKDSGVKHCKKAECYQTHYISQQYTAPFKTEPLDKRSKPSEQT